MTKSRITKFGTVENRATSIPGWTAIAGNPTMESHFHFKSDNSRVLAGTWTSTTGKYQVVYADPRLHEFVHMIEGKLVITPDGGAPVILGPGDAFVIEPGFKGTWEVVESVRKHFVLSS